MAKKLVFCIDFDNTIVVDDFPNIGVDNLYALDVIRELIYNNHKIILYTIRSNENLLAAENYLKDNGIELYGVNKNKTQFRFSNSRKVYADYYIDDKNIGTPLKDVIYKNGMEKVVDWKKIRNILIDMEILK